MPCENIRLKVDSKFSFIYTIFFAEETNDCYSDSRMHLKKHWVSCLVGWRYYSFEIIEDRDNNFWNLCEKNEVLNDAQQYARKRFLKP